MAISVRRLIVDRAGYFGSTPFVCQVRVDLDDEVRHLLFMIIVIC